MKDHELPEGDVTLREQDAEPGIDRHAIWKGLQRPAALRGLAVLVVGVVALAAPQLSAWLLSLLIGIALLVAGGTDTVAALRSRPVARADLGRGVLLLGGGTALLALRRIGVGAVAGLVGGVIAMRGVLDLVRVATQQDVEDRGWQVLRGVAQVLLGALIAVSEGDLLLFLVALMAIVWIIAGGVALAEEVSVADTGNVVLDWLHHRDMGPEERSAVINKVIFEGEAARGRISRFIALMAFSTAIATFGINADSTAVVIGAMLIAPLMTPIMATSASMLMGWPKRATRSLFLVAGGIAVAVAGSWLLSRYFPVLEVTANSQILSRVSPNTVDLMIAFAAGAAGAFALSRPDVSDSLPGVAIAVALVPPLTVIGITLEAGELEFAMGATLLFFTNLVGVILAAGVTFVFVGLSPWFHLEANQREINRSFATVGVALLLIAIPLSMAGDEVFTAVTNQGTASTVVEEWLESAPGYRTVSVAIRGSEAEVAVVGSGPLPAPESLAAGFAAEFDREITVDLSVIPEERFEVTGEP